MGVGTDYTSTETTDVGSVIRVIKQLHPVEFTDSSTNADSVLWNFGDGNTSTERNPIHNYSSNGTFVNPAVGGLPCCVSSLSSPESSPSSFRSSSKDGS